MKISVLMSVYKAEKPEYLNKALHSVWEEQTYKPHEIVLIAKNRCRFLYKIALYFQKYLSYNILCEI